MKLLEPNTETSPIGIYDRIVSPKGKLSDDEDYEGSRSGAQQKRCIAITAMVLAGIFLVVTLHATVVSVFFVNPQTDLRDSLSYLDSYENKHLSLLQEIQNEINKSSFAGVDQPAGEQEVLINYLEELHGKLDSLKKRQRELDEIRDDRIIAPAKTFDQDKNVFTTKVIEKMNFEYLAAEKVWPYVGSRRYLDSLSKDSRAYYNSLATFPYPDDQHMHGIVGLDPDGTRWWKGREKPPLYKEGTDECNAALKRGGGFYLEYSDYLPLDRDAADFRSKECKAVKFDILNLPDASIIITFYNEPLSTLLRSVHSVLNTIPPPLLREVILVDDHSSLAENLPGSALDEAIRRLPKTSVLRLPHRHGLVQARLAGIKNAQGEVVVILDSHIEATPQWLEPMLARLKESPKSLVYPQIPSIDAVNFDYKENQGIGCKLTFKWVMQEQSTAPYNYKSTEAVPSASMAGGLFAVYRDFFWHMGGYDEGMTMWGAENVEMPFRYWMCGAMVECVPCSRVYHIYRNGGVGYKSPGNAVVINRLRTAYLWLDEYYPLAHKVINDGKEIDIGEVDTILSLKERLQCKDFRWFLDYLEIDKKPKSLSDVQIVGQVKSLADNNQCLDSLNGKTVGVPFGLFTCHGTGGTQSWLSFENKQLHPSSSENMCTSWKTLKYENCDLKDKTIIWEFEHSSKTIRNHSGTECLSYTRNNDKLIEMQPCIEELEINETNKHQKWAFGGFEDKDLDYERPSYSANWLSIHK